MSPRHSLHVPSSPRPSRAHRAVALALCGLIAGLPAWGAPLGESVVNGDVDVAREGATTSVTASDGSIIEWNSFNIGVGETVEFIQPGDWARVLNRVLSIDPTIIAGTLTAPGQVYIAAPSGIYFRGTAVVDVGRLVAVGGHVSNDDFLSGNDRFELSAPVENWGSLEGDAIALLGSRVANHHSIVANDGLIVMAAGDSVWIGEHGSPILIELRANDAATAEDDARDPAAPASEAVTASHEAVPAGPAVENSGSLDAGRGSVRLAAGDLLSIALRPGSRVRANDIRVAGGEGSRVDVQGSLDASGREPGASGGAITLTGDWIAVRAAELDVSGDAGGGSIRVGGDRHGSGDLPRARALMVGEDVAMHADATTRGDGGEVVLWSEEATWAHGQISARGGAEGGDGGFIETSSKGFLSVGDAVPDASAAQGDGGLWLLDPSDLRVVSDSVSDDLANDPATAQFANLNQAFDRFSSAITANPIVFPVVPQSFVAASRVAEALADGTNVSLTTELFEGLGPDQGNITIEESIVFDSLDANPGTLSTLTLDAANDIRVFDGVVIDATTEPDGDLALNLSLNANGEGRLSGVKQPELAGQAPFGVIEVPQNSALRTGGGFVSLRAGGADPTPLVDGGDGALAGIDVQGTLETDGGDIVLATIGGNIAVGSDGATPSNRLFSQGGNVTIAAASLTSDGVTRGGSATVHGTLATEGGSAQITGIDGDVDVDGIDTRRIDGSGDPGGEITLDVANVLITDEALIGQSITVLGDLRSGGGEIEIGGTSASTATAIGPKDIAITGQIHTEGGDLLIGSADVLPDIAIAGTIDTDGGAIQVRGASASVRTDAAGDPGATFTIDTQATAASDVHGGVDVQVQDALVLEDGVSIAAGAIILRAAQDGNVDSAGASNASALQISDDVKLAADFIELRAGDGYTRNPAVAADPGDPTRKDSAIQFGAGVVVTDRASGGVAGGAGPEVFFVVQDADLSDTAIPQIADAAPPAPGESATEQSILYESSDGTLALGQSIGSAIESLTLRARSGVQDATPGSPVPIAIAADLTPGTLTLETYEALTLDSALAQHLVPINELEVRSGLASALTTSVFEAVAGDFAVAADLATADRISLQAGVGGPGSLSFEPTLNPGDLADPTAITLSANAVDLRAGNGALGSADAVVDTDGAHFASVAELSIRQDASIVSSQSVPAQFDPTLPGFETLDRLALQSDDGSVRVDSTLSAATLAFAAQSALSFADDAGTPVSVRADAFELGGLGAFTVNDTLLAALEGLSAPRYEALTLSSGAGNLTLGVSELRADRLTLISGLDSSNATPYVVSGLAATDLLNTAGTGAPDSFTFVQKSLINDTTTESFRFPDGSRPDQVRLRSDDPLQAPISLVRLEQALQAGGVFDGVSYLTLEGEEVLLSRLDGTDLNLVSDTKILVRADEMTFTAVNGALAGPCGSACARVLVRPEAGNPATGELRVAGVEADFDPDFDAVATFERTLPADAVEPVLSQLAILQDGDLGVASIPTIAGSQDGASVFLESNRANISLVDAADLLSGTQLVLSLNPNNAADTGVPARSITFPVETLRPAALNIQSPDAFTLADARIDVTPEDGSVASADNFIVVRVASSGDGNLTIDEDVELTANGIELTAGSGSGNSDIVILGAGPAIAIETDAAGTSALTVQQDVTLEHDPRDHDPLDTDPANSLQNLPMNITVTDADTARGEDRIGLYTLRSLNGSVIVREVSDLAAQEVQIGVEPAAGSVVLEDEDGDLNLTLDTDALRLFAPNVELRAADRVIAEAGGLPGPLEFNGIFSLSIFQGDAFAPAQLPSTSSFVFTPEERAAGANGRLLGIAYRLERTSDRSGIDAITLNSALAERVTGSSLFLAAPDEVIIAVPADLASLAVEAVTVPEGQTAPPAPITRLALSGPDPEDTTLAVSGALRFDGDLDLGRQSPTLQGRDVRIGGDVSGARTVGLTIRATRDVEFGGDLGSDSARIAHLDVQLDESAGLGPNVLFSGGDRSIDVVDSVTIRSGVDPVSGVAGGRALPSAVATIAATGDLDIESEALGAAPDDSGFAINFGPTGGLAGGGEKLAVPGTATLRAGCGSAAGSACTGAVRVGDVSALEFVVNAAQLDIVRRGAATVLAAGGSSDHDAGVDLIANDFALSRVRGDTPGPVPALTTSGGGKAPVFGVPSAAEIQPFMTPFPVASIFPSSRRLTPSDFSDVVGSDVVYFDLQPKGGSFADLSPAFDERTPAPTAVRPPQPRDRVAEPLDRVGIEVRPATAAEFTGTLGGAGIYDDASLAWGESGHQVAASRLDVDGALRAVELHREVMGDGYANAETIRANLTEALRNYRRSTGATRVLGFELRRWLTNRPASQFDAYRTLQDLDHLFSAHRRSGLARSEYERIQRGWLERIKPEGIELTELAETIHPTRYVRGSDILDIFGD